jgi:hypothetical protein
MSKVQGVNLDADHSKQAFSFLKSLTSALNRATAADFLNMRDNGAHGRAPKFYACHCLSLIKLQQIRRGRYQPWRNQV